MSQSTVISFYTNRVCFPYRMIIRGKNTYKTLPVIRTNTVECDPHIR